MVGDCHLYTWPLGFGHCFEIEFENKNYCIEKEIMIDLVHLDYPDGVPEMMSGLAGSSC